MTTKAKKDFITITDETEFREFLESKVEMYDKADVKLYRTYMYPDSVSYTTKNSEISILFHRLPGEHYFTPELTFSEVLSLKRLFSSIILAFFEKENVEYKSTKEFYKQKFISKKESMTILT